MDFVEAFLNVLAILGIIIAGGFIIFFLGDVLVSALDSKNPKPKKEKIKQKSEIYVHEANNAKKQNKEYLFSNEDDLSVDDKDEGTITEFIPDEEPITEKPSSEYEQFNGFNDFFDFNKTNNEPRNLSVIDSEVKALAEEARESQALDDNQEKSFDELNDLFNEKDVNFGDDFDFNFDDISQDENANMESIYEEIMSKNKEVTDAGFNVANNIIEGTVKQPEFEIKEINQLQSKFIEGQAYNYEESTVSKDKSKDYEATYDILNISRDNIKKNLDFETLNESKLKQEVQQLKQDLYEQKLEYEKIKTDSEQNESKLKIELNELQELYTQAEKQEAEKETKPTAILSKEEYEKRLETLKARLKANEKELRVNKREFVPLRRVRKNLDSDKKKLRRREALVAKQKVMLYGVNNMASIDEEKANKLAEDLDLLDGLKISVKHCEEVMEANKERYPILETTHRILTTVIKDLKEDIAECEAKIKMYEESDETNDDGNTKKESIVLETNSVNVEHEQEPINNDEIVIETKEQDINEINEIKVEAEETMEAVNEVETKDIEKTKEEQSILNDSATDIVADLDELTEILSVNNDENKKANKKPKI